MSLKNRLPVIMSAVLFLAGLVMVVQPQLFGQAIAYIDGTAPTLSSPIPINQGTYGSIETISIRARDSVTGVKSVTFSDSYTGETRALTRTSGTINDGIWTVTAPPFPINQWISYEFAAKDYNGNEETYRADFKLVALKGYWIVTDGTSSYRSDQDDFDNIRLTGSTLTFKFIETEGDAVTCTVSYTQVVGGTETGTVTMTSNAGYWEGTKTFTDGKYQIEMSASDGTTAPITAAIIPVGTQIPTVSLAQITGGVFMTVAAIYVWKQQLYVGLW